MTVEAAQEALADYFDGSSSRKHRVALRLGDALEIVADDAVIASWPYDTIRRADGPPHMLRLSSMAAPPLARIEIEDEATKEAVTARCPALDVGRGGAGQTLRVVFWSIAAVCSILGMIYYGIPLAADRLAPLVPTSFEQRIGDTVARQVQTMFQGKVCEDAQGQKAFATLMEKLRAAGGIDQPLRSQVLSSPVPNALALPGGRVIMLNGLLQLARNPDELAGVLAHELGHVQHRHVMRSIIQTGGTSFLIGLLLGDVTGGAAVIFVARNLVDASHTRASEREADDFAVTVMQRLGRSPLPMAELLFRVTGAQKKILGGFTILNSHPLTEDRLAMMKKVDRPNSGPELLSAEEWQALKNVCKTG